MRIAVVVFPGSGGAADVSYAYGDVLGQEVFTVWHQEEVIENADVLVIPGGSAFGDYLRPGALCRPSPVVGAIRKFAREDRPVIGIGNGFQILCELELLPGVLLPNYSSRFLNTMTYVCTENTKSVWTRHLDKDEIRRMPINCYCGRYYADKRTLKDLEEEGHVAFRFCDIDGDVDPQDPFNGSLNGIAGILNRHENVLGMIHHAERAIEDFMGSTDGLDVLKSVLMGDITPTAHDDDDDDRPRKRRSNEDDDDDDEDFDDDD